MCPSVLLDSSPTLPVANVSTAVASVMSAPVPGLTSVYPAMGWATWCRGGAACPAPAPPTLTPPPTSADLVTGPVTPARLGAGHTAQPAPTLGHHWHMVAVWRVHQDTMRTTARALTATCPATRVVDLIMTNALRVQPTWS